MRAAFPSLIGCLVSSGCNLVLGGFPADAELRCEDRVLPINAALEEGLGELVFAQRIVEHVRDTGEATSEPVGYDLDQGITCTPPPWGAPVLDSSPIDNAFGSASAAFAHDNNAEPLHVALSRLAESGDRAQLFRIFGYNGQSDDPEIEVALFDGSMGERAAADHGVPRWDGTDVWHAEEEDMVAVDGCWIPRAHVRAEVKNFAIVAPAFTNFSFQDFRLQATLEQIEGRWYLSNGLLGGAWPIHDFLVEVGKLGQFFCTTSSLYPSIREHYCPSVDMDTDEDGICDALSAGAVFEAHPIRLGGVRRYPDMACSPRENPGSYDCDREPPP